MSLYIPQMGDAVGVTIPGLAGNFETLSDHLVKYGSNVNGEYWRWGDGLQICTRLVPQGTIVPSYDSVVNGLYRSANIRVASPAAFSVTSLVAAAAEQVAFSYGNLISAVFDAGTNEWVFRVAKVASWSGTDYLHNTYLIAIGRWK